jgi:hypothetical protein
MNTEEAHELAMFAVWWLVKFGLIKVCAVQIIEPAILKISLESFVHDFGKFLSLGLKKCFYTTGGMHHGPCMPAKFQSLAHSFIAQFDSFFSFLWHKVILLPLFSL